jgi:lincosamide nucleotidyltransferase A/C/D/E
MRAEDVINVLNTLDSAGVRHWVGGGWGVAALAGQQTREHRDLDLAVDAEDLGCCLKVLDELGYAVETDWLPVRIELRAPDSRWVDVHPVTFGADHHGRQPDLDGGHFDYPPTAFASGSIGGRLVNCLSVQQQRQFHVGYDHRPQDIHDLAELDAAELRRHNHPAEPPAGRCCGVPGTGQLAGARVPELFRAVNAGILSGLPDIRVNRRPRPGQDH